MTFCAAVDVGELEDAVEDVLEDALEDTMVVVRLEESGAAELWLSEHDERCSREHGREMRYLEALPFALLFPLVAPTPAPTATAITTTAARASDNHKVVGRRPHIRRSVLPDLPGPS